MIEESSKPGSANSTQEAWRMIKYWLQLSSGWVSAPKNPEDMSKLIESVCPHEQKVEVTVHT